MQKTFLTILLTVLLGFFTLKGQNAHSAHDHPSKKGKRVEVLFLGDNGHHRPSEMVPLAMSSLGPRGINFTYTNRLADLNPETLAKFDALLLYANWDSIGAKEADALLTFVASGKGFVPVHCGSYCFRNNSEVVKLIGGQFWKHTWDTIRPVWAKPEHPALMGAKPFETVDETYLHTKLQPDNVILTERIIGADQKKDRPGTTNEPYTWAREYGKGRVFYTAYGHDERTWSQPGFIDLLEKGILWAVGDTPLKQLKSLNPKKMEYRVARLPNYEQRPGQQMEQLPLSPEESMKHIQVPVDFKLELFAHEPDVMHPIALTWDDRGRLFVLITKDYPNARKESGGSDYILLCEDLDHDGRADKFTRFADSLSIPTGMVFATGGLIVSQAPHMLFLKDTNGDDKVDQRNILLSGFGTFDTHAGPSNLYYGFDNWIYGSLGYSGFKGKFGAADSLNFGQALFRFRPDGSDMEAVTRTSNNTWGLGFDESGNIFGSTANNSHGWYAAIPSRYLKNWRDNGGRSTDTHKGMQPITPKVRQVDVFGGFTAAAGHTFYTARAFPKPYWNKAAFVSEPTGHLVHQNFMVKNGTDFADSLGFNFLAGSDEWVAPVFAETGPDGAVWIADWYSYIIQHNPVPKGFDNGAGNAYETDLRDFTHGRIYRVSWKNAQKSTFPTLNPENPKQLVKVLKNENLFWRIRAQKLLVERGKPDIIPELLRLLSDTTQDEIGLNPGAIHALWTFHGLGLLENDSVSKSVISLGLSHPSAAVRKNAIQVLPNNAVSVNGIFNSGVLDDPDALVVLNALLALSKSPLTRGDEDKILARLAQATEAESADRWLPDAFAVVLNANSGALRKKYLLARKGSSDTGKNRPDDAVAGSQQSPDISTDSTLVKGAADLVISDIKAEPSTLRAREPLRITLIVRNQGENEITSEQIPQISLTIRGKNTSVNFVSNELKNGLKPGETVFLKEGNNGPWKTSFGLVPEQAGNLAITAGIDGPNQIAEADDENNVLMKEFNVQPPPKLADYALERAVRNYSFSAPIDSVFILIKEAKNLDADARLATLKGVLGGWDNRRRESVNDASKVLLLGLAGQIPGELNSDYLSFMRSAGIAEEKLSDPNVQTITLSAIKEAMKFDKPIIDVEAGKPVAIVFQNPDAMPHNVVVGKPNSLEIIGNAADKMITEADAADKNYVPTISEVLASTALVGPDETVRLEFTLSAAGEYPFVCTFPGHWRIMKGVIRAK